jgi:serine/threonine-protein kinase
MKREAAMVVTSAEEFLALLEKSGLLIPAQLIQVRSTVAADENAKTLARNLAHRNLITRWQAAQLLAGRSSFYLGKYRLIELLGRGGLGSAFLAEHVTMNRRVVLKVISRQVSTDPTLLERFLVAARAVAALDHPNIVHAYSIDNEFERYFLVMEFFEGVDLQHLVTKDGPLDCERAVAYIRQAADGLDYAHQRNMIHGNLKASHLLVNAQGVLKILDLGLAGLSAGESTTAAEGPRASTSFETLAAAQAMMSPDLALSADLYALGCALYFLLTSQPPQGQVRPTDAAKQLTSEPPDVRLPRPDVPPALAAICRKMMAKKPEDGYPTAAAVSLALAQWQESMPRLKRAMPPAKPLEEP